MSEILEECNNLNKDSFKFEIKAAVWKIYKIMFNYDYDVNVIVDCKSKQILV